MILPSTDTPLVTLAENQGVVSLMKNFIEHGGGIFMIDAWTAYSTIHLRNKNLLDGMTAVGGMDLGRRIFEAILLDFEAQMNHQEKETEEEKK